MLKALCYSTLEAIRDFTLAHSVPAQRDTLRINQTLSFKKRGTFFNRTKLNIAEIIFNF